MPMHRLCSHAQFCDLFCTWARACSCIGFRFHTWWPLIISGSKNYTCFLMDNYLTFDVQSNTVTNSLCILALVLSPPSGSPLFLGPLLSLVAEFLSPLLVPPALLSVWLANGRSFIVRIHCDFNFCRESHATVLPWPCGDGLVPHSFWPFCCRHIVPV